MLNVLWIPGWHPTPLGKLMGGMTRRGQMYRHTLKKADAATIATAANVHGITKAAGPRRLDLIIIVEAGKRRCDRDAYWKSAKDGLKLCGLLVDDTPRLCVDGAVRFAKAMDELWGTFLILEDLP